MKEMFMIVKRDSILVLDIIQDINKCIKVFSVLPLPLQIPLLIRNNNRAALLYQPAFYLSSTWFRVVLLFVECQFHFWSSDFRYYYPTLWIVANITVE